MGHSNAGLQIVQLLPVSPSCLAPDPLVLHLQLQVTGVNPNTRALTIRALKVCNSYLYILDQVLLPTPNNSLSAIPEVNATFLQALASLGNTGSSSSSSTAVGNVTDSVSSTKA